ncbi:hypothetical protein BKA70DRAFT_773772 [Coprinopsis sp. MPI-PUGE-AT-0042]|nr:hypothetical protein BKA70DRAFT_773772 [Coprinopsis sp. MPI-PUGE-AT-0042]
MSSLFPTFHETLGAASIGFSLSCGVFGILTTQMFIYFRRYPNDTVGYKVLVVAMWLLELIDQIFVGYSIYYYTISQYGKPLVLFLEDIVWPLLVGFPWLSSSFMHPLPRATLSGPGYDWGFGGDYCQNVRDGILSKRAGWDLVNPRAMLTITNSCFAIRVWRFSHHNIYLTAPIFLLILSQLGAGIAYCVRGFQVGKLLFAHQLRVVASLSLGAGMVTDAYIAITLCLLLHRLRTGFKQSDTLINSLIIYAVSTGALTGIVSFATLLVYNVYPRTFYFMTFYFLLGKLYAISLITTLNTRKSVKGKGTDRRDGESTGGALTFNPRGGLAYIRSEGLPSQSVTSGKVEAQAEDDTELKTLEVEIRREVSVSSDDHPNPLPPPQRSTLDRFAPDPEVDLSHRFVPNRRKPS